MQSPDYIVWVPVVVSFILPACVLHLLVLSFHCFDHACEFTASEDWVLASVVTQVIINDE